jgi:hypothetical protein
LRPVEKNRPARHTETRVMSRPVDLAGPLLSAGAIDPISVLRIGISH